MFGDDDGDVGRGPVSNYSKKIGQGVVKSVSAKNWNWDNAFFKKKEVQSINKRIKTYLLLYDERLT